MGTWAAGNFDSDSAMGFIDDAVEEKFIGPVREAIVEFDETDGEWLMAAIDAICVLAERCNATTPGPEEVDSWREAYLRNWDNYIDELDPVEDFKSERRRVIETTFQRLQELATKRHS